MRLRRFWSSSSLLGSVPAPGRVSPRQSISSWHPSLLSGLLSPASGFCFAVRSGACGQGLRAYGWHLPLSVQAVCTGLAAVTADSFRYPRLLGLTARRHRAIRALAALLCSLLGIQLKASEHHGPLRSIPTFRLPGTCIWLSKGEIPSQVSQTRAFFPLVLLHTRKYPTGILWS